MLSIACQINRYRAYSGKYYLKLLRRDFEIHVSKANSAKVNFITFESEGEEYYQVAYTVIHANCSLEHELSPLNAMRVRNHK